MAATADDWRDAYGTERGGRLAVAFGVSLVCHLALLVALRGLRMEAHATRPLVVTMIARGGAGEGDGGTRPAAGDAVPVPAAVAAALQARPAMAPVPAAPRVKTPRATRAATPPRRAVPAAQPAVMDAAVAPSLPPSVTSAIGGAGDDVAGTAQVGSGQGAGAVATANGGSGTGRGGSGGADGLRAFCASCPAPEYPARARRQGWQGTVDVELAITADGSVWEARVGRSSGYPALDDVALDVARRSRFAVPAGGDELRGQLRYRFVLDATAARR